MNISQITDEIEQLPPEAQHQIEDFILFMKVRYQPAQKVNIAEPKKMYQPQITKGDKSIDPSGLFGIWKDTPRNLEDIRKKAWQRDWNTQFPPYD